jgi:trigger factor
MKVEVKKLPKSEVELTITVPYDVYKKWEKKALEEISKEIKVSGFRSGNIPENIVRENVRPEAIKAATLDFVLPQTYTEAVKANDVQVVAQPKVDIKSDVVKEGDDFVYVATVAVMPELKMGDYKKIKIARKPVVVEKDRVDETINMVMDRYAEWKDVERKAKEGDRVEISFEGFDEEGKAIPNTASKNHPIILGSKTMVPGFEDGVVGMSKGEEKEFEVTFPKEYHSSSMQGKKVKFKANLLRLEEKLEQKLDEEMIEKIAGKKQSVDEFRKVVEDSLKEEIENRNREEHDNEVVNEIIKITKVELPEALIEQEVENMLEEQKHRVKDQGLEWDQYLKHIKKTEEDFAKEHRKPAEERIIARLGVQHILKDADIKVSDEEVEAKITEMASHYPEEQKKVVFDHFKEEKANKHLRHNMAADKLIDMLSK